jgi:hypothetical protein
MWLVFTIERPSVYPSRSDSKAQCGCREKMTIDTITSTPTRNGLIKDWRYLQTGGHYLGYFGRFLYYFFLGVLVSLLQKEPFYYFSWGLLLAGLSVVFAYNAFQKNKTNHNVNISSDLIFQCRALCFTKVTKVMILESVETGKRYFLMVWNQVDSATQIPEL